MVLLKIIFGKHFMTIKIYDDSHIVHTHAESILTITIIVENWTKIKAKMIHGIVLMTDDETLRKPNKWPA